MDRIYNKANNTDYSNQSGLINFTTGSNLSVFNKSKTPPGGSIDRLIENKILNNLPGKVLEIFLASMKSVSLETGESIYCPDEAIRFFYFPETAVFSEFRILADGRAIEIIMTGREGVTGASSLINAHSPDSFTKVLQGGRAFRIDSKSLVEKLSDKPEIRELICAYLNQFINNISQKVICSGFHLMESRLCTWLLMLQDRTGSHRLNLTHEQIALSLGAHRPSVTQITKKLREEEMIDYMRGAISILNQRKLEAAACSCYTAIH